MTRIPLDDHAAMYVAASRRRQPPHVGVVRRFDRPIDGETLAEYAAQLGANPRGFGRRVVRPRVPGARPRWEPAVVIPPVRIESEPLTAAGVANVLDDEVSAQPDPTRGSGWQLTALAGDDGGTIVLTWLHHAYGDGRSILETAFHPGSQEAVAMTSAVARSMEELGDIVGRVRQGVAGGVRLGREAATVGWREPHSDLARLRPALTALRARDRGVGYRSQRRIIALARIASSQWDDAAAARGGSGNALLVAVLANLLRSARRSRGEVLDRPLRLLLPFDTRLRAAGGGDDRRADNCAGAATIIIPGGVPAYGSLQAVRAATKAALAQATAAARGAPARPPGVIDAMQLLPGAITQRVAVRVQAHCDGVASNVGAIPAHVAQLGPHVAEEVFLLASPMLTDITVCLGRDHGHVALGVMADPARLGPSGGLREHVAEELTAWGLDPAMR